jgi:hypothetical protein
MAALKQGRPAGVPAPAQVKISGKLECVDDIKGPSSFQSFGDIAAGIIAKIAARHRLSEPHAAVVVELAGIGRAVRS